MNVLLSIVPNQAWLLKGGGVFLSMGCMDTRINPKNSHVTISPFDKEGGNVRSLPFPRANPNI
jgi:hypothetical protein